jgi:hypothetical protein
MNKLDGDRMSPGLVCVELVGFTALAVVFLAWRDRRRRRELEARIPVVERIAAIRAGAAFMAAELQRILDRNPDAPPARTEWIPPVREYYVRLQQLAACPLPSEEDALRLAEEAGQYVRQRRLKGIWVAQEARKLAALARRQDAA